MERLFGILMIAAFLGCPSPTPQSSVIETEDYELHLTGDLKSKLLIVFPGLGQNAESIKEAFKILSPAAEQNTSVLLMNFNHRLHLTQEEESELTDLLELTLSQNNLVPEEVIIGGFSSGGIISVLWSDYLMENEDRPQPNQVFVIDSPLDLKELYFYVTDVDSSSHPLTLQEADFITNYFVQAFPESENVIDEIPSVSPFDYASGSLKNIARLKEIPLRVYTEPDSTWWRENRGFEFEATNGFQLTRFAEFAQSQGWDKLELIQTKNKGYRPNGDRHPHSWSIVDVDEFMDWIESK